MPRATRTPEGNPPKARMKRKREVEDRQDEILRKKLHPSQTWSNLDLVLSLQSKDLGLAAKIESAFDYVNSEDARVDQPLRTTRFAAFLGDWMQHSMISSHKGSPDSGICSDFRCWTVLKFCLETSDFRITPHILRPIAAVLRLAASRLETAALEREDDGLSRLCSGVTECLSMLFESHGRTINNAGVDLWVTCAVAAVDVVRLIFSGERFGEFSGKDVLLQLSGLILEQFSTFLRTHPSPRNTFRPFVDRLLESLLELGASLHEQVKDGDDAKILTVLDDVLSHGLFHSSHMSGFLNLKGLKGRSDDEETTFRGSYHRHLFQKVKRIVLDRKGSAMVGFGNLYRCFISKAKKIRDDQVVSSRGFQVSEKESDPSGVLQEINQPIFEVFMHLIEPLLLECNKFSNQGHLLKDGDSECSDLSAALFVVKSMSSILAELMHEKIYTRTEDTDEGENYNFLKEVHDIIMSMSKNLHHRWSLITDGKDFNCLDTKVLNLLATEIVALIGHLMEIEYKIVGVNLPALWLMMLSSLFHSLSSEASKDTMSLKSKVLHIACQLINLYGELRQVNIPIFALCKAVRLFLSEDDGKSAFVFFIYNRSLSSKSSLEAVATFLLSQPFKLVTSNAIRLIPEGQTSVFIEQLNEDIGCSLTWIRNHVSGTEGKDLIDSKTDLKLQFELLGMLSELYATMLDSLLVKVSNGNSIKHAVEKVLDTIHPFFSGLLVGTSEENDDGFLYLVTGIKLARKGLLKLRTGSITAKAYSSWFLMFLFRLYVSCRSLYQQVIFVLPKNPEKAAGSMGNVFLVAHGESWIRTNFDGNYFTWITEPSVSLLAVVEFTSAVFLRGNIFSHAPFAFVLLTMILQRLVDLNRQIKGFEHLLQRLTRSTHADLVCNRGLPLDMGKEELMHKFDVSKKEAVDLTNIMMAYFPSVASIWEAMSSWNDAPITEDDTWSSSFSVCSLSGKMLPLAVWQVLCKNMHVWCPHANTRMLKIFISPLICGTIPEKHSINIGSRRKIEQCLYMQEMLSGFLVLDHMALSRHFASGVLRNLKKSLSRLVSHACVGRTDLKLLPDWSEALHALEELSVVYCHTRNASAVNTSSLGPHTLQLVSCHREGHIHNDPSGLELRICESLINLLCLVVKVHISIKLIKRAAIYILHLEKLIILTLLRKRDGCFVSDHFELLKLFVSCRRLLRYIGVESFEGNMADKKSPLEMIFCENQLSISWILKSASEIVGLPYDFFGTENCHKTKALAFSLMDHTSHLFSVLTKGLMLTCLCTTSDDDGMVHQDPSFCDKVAGHIVIETPASRSTPHCRAWQHFELVAEHLKKDVETLLNFFKETMLEASLDVDHGPMNCNKFSCTISCVVGFLYGISSILSTKVPDALTGSNLKFMVSHGIKLYSYVNLFDGFVNNCLNMLLLDGQSMKLSCNLDSERFCHKHNLPNVDDAIDASGLCNDRNVHASSSHKQDDTSIAHTNDECEDSPCGCPEGLAVYKAKMTDSLDVMPLLDLLNLQTLKRDLLLRLLKGESLEISILIRQLFLSSAAALHLYNTPLPKAWRLKTHNSSMSKVLVGTSHLVLSEFGEMNWILDSCYYPWLDGPIKYLEVLGRYFSSVADPVLSRTLYSNLVDAHFRAIGKCISLLGKAAVLASHDTGSSASILSFQCQFGELEISHSTSTGHCLDVLKARLGSSFVKFAKTSVQLHFLSAIQALERALVGVHQGFHMIYEINIGNLDGGRVSSVVAAGIYCFDLILEKVSGNHPSTVLKRHMRALTSSLFNIIAHLKCPTIFYSDLHGFTRGKYPDSGAVILMCIEVLAKITVKSSVYQMDRCHVAQSLNMPMSLFHCFKKHNASQVQDHAYKVCSDIIDRRFSLELYAACCRLLSATIRHRKSESADCIYLLQGSVEALLDCLETTNANIVNKKDYFVWTQQEAVKCASFLRRVYEEIRQQKELLAMYSAQFLSTYISISSGFGSLKTGIEREVEEALRPGIYALVDMCSPDDLQLVHTVLGEPSCRRTLANLQRDYKLNFQYMGMV